MRFVYPKSAEYQVRAVLFRVRQKVIAKRIERMNALRSLLYKFGFIASVDLQHLPNWSGQNVLRQNTHRNYGRRERNLAGKVRELNLT